MENGCSGQIEVVSAGSESKVVSDWEESTMVSTVLDAVHSW